MAKPTAMAPMRTRAMALSLMLTRSAPASRMSSADSSVRSMRTERGGSISTLTTKRPSASAVARPVGGGAATSTPRGRAARPRDQRRGAPRQPPSRRRRRRRPAAPRSPHGAARAPPRGRGPGAWRRRARASCRSSRPRAVPRRPGSGAPPRRSRPGVGGPHELAADAAGQAGVGHDRAAGVAGGRLRHLLQHLDAGDGAGPAVDAQGVDARRVERASRPSAAVVPSATRRSSPKRHRGHDGQVAGAPGGLDGRQQVAQVAGRLDHDQVDAALQQALELLAGGAPGLAVRRGGSGRAAAS